MKKIVVVAAMLMAAGFISAEKFEVKSVTGKVTYEAAPGKWVEVKVGQKLSDSTVLNTSVNSKVTIVPENGAEVTVKAMQKGTVSALSKANVAVAKGLKKNPASTVASKRIADEVTESNKGVATASSRASEAKDDFEIDE